MNRFAIGIGWRIGLVVLLALLMGYWWWMPYPRVLPIFSGVFLIGLAVNLFVYCTSNASFGVI